MTFTETEYGVLVKILCTERELALVETADLLPGFVADRLLTAALELKKIQPRRGAGVLASVRKYRQRINNLEWLVKYGESRLGISNWRDATDEDINVARSNPDPRI